MAYWVDSGQWQPVSCMLTPVLPRDSPPTSIVNLARAIQCWPIGFQKLISAFSSLS